METGRGDEATQSQHGSPEGHRLIFAVVAERWLRRRAGPHPLRPADLAALRITTLSKNLYGSMVGAGIAAMLLFQVFVNVGMNLGIMPVTGIPLPLMTYGGSSVLTTFLAIGVLQSVYVQSQLASPGRVRNAL